MAVTAGIDIEPAPVPVASGIQSGIAPRSATADGTDPASFQSSLQSMVDSSGNDLDGSGAPQTPSQAPGDTGSSTAQPGASQKPAAQNSGTQNNTTQSNSAQIAAARYRPGSGIHSYLELLASLQPDAESGSAGPGASNFANSPAPSKTAKYPGSTEKKPATAGAVISPTVAIVPDLAAPVLENLPLQHARAVTPTAAHPAQSFLTSAQPAAAGQGGILPAPAGPAPAAASGVAVSGQADAAAPTHAHAAHAAAQADSAQDASAASGANAAAAADRADINPADTNPAGVNSSVSNSADSHVNALKDVPGTASAAAASTGAAHSAAASDTSSARRVSESAAPRAMHGLNGLNGYGSAEPAPGSPPVQQIMSGGDASAPGRDATLGHGAVNGGTQSLPVGASASSAAGPDTHETFVALDSDAARGTSWIHAGAHSAEAGFQDPSLGWVSVRADLAAGSVHASVVPGTADAAQALSGHMAGLNSYLNDHRTPVQTLTLASPGGDAGFSQMAGQGGGQQSGGSGGANQQSSPQPSAISAAQLSQPGGPAGFTRSNAVTATMRMGASISLIA